MRDLELLFADKTSGSLALLDNFINFLRTFPSHGDVRPILVQAKKKWCQFEAIQHFIQESERSLIEEGIDRYKDFLNTYASQWGPQLIDAWASTLLQLFDFTHPKRVLLHSNSQTVTQTLDALSPHASELRILQTLSAPLNEGLIQGETLTSHGLEVTIIADSLAATQVKECDFVLLGADGFHGNTFRNKIGSLGICLGAQFHSVPVIVLLDGRKVSKGPPPHPTDQDAGELFDITSHPSLQGINHYFEDIPASLVSHYITESGLMSPDTLTQPSQPN